MLNAKQQQHLLPSGPTLHLMRAAESRQRLMRAAESRQRTAAAAAEAYINSSLLKQPALRVPLLAAV
jgi:hypothetical protein